MPTLVAELIEDTKRHLYGATRLELNRLSAGIGTNETTLAFEFELKGIARGSLISIDDEVMYVLDSTVASKNANVMRGFMGTVPATHDIESTVEVNPRFPREFIKEALKREINSWGPRLFRVTGHDLAISVSGTAYDLPIGDYYHIVDIRSRTTGSTRWPLLRGWSLGRNFDTTEFSSGSALLLSEAPAVGSTLRLRIARPFDTSSFTDSTDVEADVGLSTSMVDIPSLGAAYRLLSTREIPRTSMAAQPEPRRAEEVPPGHISSVVTQLKRIRDERISEEQFTLREFYPYRSS